MKTKHFFQAAIALFVSASIFVSCEQDTTTDELAQTNTTTSVNVESYVDIISNLITDVDETTEEASSKTATKETFLDRCFDVNYYENTDGAFWPRSWSVVYSADGCTDFHGNIRTGQIDVLLTAYWKEEGSTRTTTYNGFSFNENAYEGTLTIANTGQNADGQLTFTRQFDGSITNLDEQTFSWTCNKDVVMTAGQETFPFQDDEYAVTGTANGNDYEGNDFTMTINTPLIYVGCSRFPVSGTLTISTAGQSDIVIDYGDGTCDDIATATQDGETTEIQLGQPRG